MKDFNRRERKMTNKFGNIFTYQTVNYDTILLEYIKYMDANFKGEVYYCAVLNTDTGLIRFYRDANDTKPLGYFPE